MAVSVNIAWHIGSRNIFHTEREVETAAHLSQGLTTSPCARTSLAQDGGMVAEKRAFVRYFSISTASGDWFNEWGVIVDTVGVVWVTAMTYTWNVDMRYVLHVNREGLFLTWVSHSRTFYVEFLHGHH